MGETVRGSFDGGHDGLYCGVPHWMFHGLSHADTTECVRVCPIAYAAGASHRKRCGIISPIGYIMEHSVRYLMGVHPMGCPMWYPMEHPMVSPTRDCRRNNHTWYICYGTMPSWGSPWRAYWRLRVTFKRIGSYATNVTSLERRLLKHKFWVRERASQPL